VSDARSAHHGAVRISSMMQNAIDNGFFVIPAHAGIQSSLFFPIQESWTPAFAGVTNRFASSC